VKELIGRLRDMVQTLRRTPMPIADVIPLLQKSADGLDSLTAERDAMKDDAARYRLEEKPCGDIWLHAKQFSINLGHKASTDPIYKLMQESARIDAAIAKEQGNDI
jgi:hypothetical protein